MHATLASLWSEYSQRRLEWAQQAYAEFLTSIAPELAVQYRDHREEATVAVFGKTQVGKTTLILHLMEVTSEFVPLVSQVLRGGRAKGRSATPTAMMYSRSLDSRWHLTVEGETTSCESGTSMEDALNQLRAKMEAGQLSVTRPVQVHLPTEVFASPANTNLAVNIIDLPGDSPANATEQAHVSQVASQYIPNADLVLLVGKADDLGFLDPEKLVLPVLGDWRYSPSRFRLITTFTMQSASFREWLTRQQVLDSSAIRHRLLAQLQTFDDIELPLDARQPSLYFPLEFGESWEVLKTTAPQVHAIAQPVMSTLLHDLKRDIQQAASPHMRLWRATQVHIVANRVKRGHERQARADIQKLIDAATATEARAQFLGQSAKTLIAQANALPAKTQTELLQVNLSEQLKRMHVQLPASAPSENKKVSAFLDALSENLKALIRMGHSFEPAAFDGFDPAIHAPSPAKVREWIEPLMWSFRRRLNDYRLDAYHSWLFKSFEQDVADFNRLGHECIERLKACLQRHWHDTVASLIKAWDIQRQALWEQSEVAQADAAALRKKSMELTQVVQEMERQLQEFVGRLERDETTGALFVKKLEDAYAKQAAEVVDTYRQQSTPAAKFLVLLALRQLHDEKTYLFSLGHAEMETAK